MADDERRLKTIKVSLELLVAMSRKGAETHTQVLRGLPDGAKIVEAYCDPTRFVIYVTVYHPSFDPVPPLENPPELAVVFERLTHANASVA